MTRRNYRNHKDHARPLSLRDSEKVTIDWQSSIYDGLRHDLDVQVRLNEAVNRACRTIEEVIKILDITHLELPNPRSTYDCKTLREETEKLKTKLSEGITEYSYKKFRYQTLIHFCDDNKAMYSLPLFPQEDIEIWHEKTGTLKFPIGTSQKKIIEVLEKLIRDTQEK